MRVLNQKVKRYMLLFGAAAVACLAAVGACVGMVVSAQSEQYTIAAGSTVFDNAYNQVAMDNEGYISRGWDREYSLTTEGDKKSLGRQTVVYEPSGSLVKIFGSGYRFYQDGTVSMLEHYTPVENLNETAFFKLSDRMYLITGSRIWDNTGVVNTGNYLFIILDDAGNARLLNDVMNVVAVEDGMVLYSDGLEFALQEQSAVVGGNAVDLTTVIGSIGALGSSRTTEAGGEVYDITVRGGDGGNGGTGGTGGVGGTGGTGGNGGTGGTGGVGGVGGTGGVGGIGGTGGTGVSGMGGGLTSAGRTYMVLKSVAADPVSLDIDYQIADPFGNYGVGYILVYDAAAGLDGYSDTQTYTMPVSLDDTSIRITQYTAGVNEDGTPRLESIQPNTQYTVEIGYYSGEDADAPYRYLDIMRTATTSVESSLRITQLQVSGLTAQMTLDADTSMSEVYLKVIQADESGGAMAEGVYALSGSEISAAKSGGGLTLAVALDGLFEEETFQSLNNESSLLKLELWVKYTGTESGYGSRLNSCTSSNPYTSIEVGGYSLFQAMMEDGEEDASTGSLQKIQDSVNGVLEQVKILSEAQQVTKGQLDSLQAGGNVSADSGEVAQLQSQLAEQQRQNQELMGQLESLNAQLEALKQGASDSGEEDAGGEDEPAEPEPSEPSAPEPSEPEATEPSVPEPSEPETPASSEAPASGSETGTAETGSSQTSEAAPAE